MSEQTETSGKRDYMAAKHIPGMQEGGVPAMRLAGAGSAWLIVRAMQGREHRLCELIDGMGWEHYRPILLKPHINRRTKRVEHVPTPMFGAYLFVRPRAGQGLQIYTTAYVAAVDRMAVMDTLIATMRQREHDGILAMMDRKKLTAGRKIRVATAGAIVDAVVSEPIDARRIELVTRFFNGSARFYCTAEQVIGTAA